MISIKQILVPCDFSEGSEVALKYARELARAFAAKLHLIHVLEEPLFYAAGPDFVPPTTGFYENLERHLDDRLHSLLSPEETQQYQTQFATPRGSPFVEIIQYAKSQGIDLIVMGTHGRGPIAHMLMGSVTEKVVRKAPCPVLTVRHPQHEFVMP